MNQDIVDDGNATLKKGIEVVMARGQSDLDAIDSKTFNYLLYRAYHRLREGGIHQVPVADVLNFLRVNSVSRVMESLAKLGRVTIEIDYVDPTTEAQHQVSAHYLSFDASKAEGGMLLYAFDPILLRFLWNPKIYAKINLSFIRQFKTPYGAQLYEVMSLYANRFNTSWTPTIDMFREKLGVPPGQYERFDNLKRNVIEKAVEEVNAIAPFMLEVDYVRGGRGGKVSALRIDLKPRSANDLTTDGVKSRKPAVRDPHTVDMLDGRTDAERGTDLVLKPETYEHARSMFQEYDVELAIFPEYEDDWRESVSGRIVQDPDLMFLRWLALRLESRNSELLNTLDKDLFTALLEDYE